MSFASWWKSPSYTIDNLIGGVAAFDVGDPHDVMMRTCGGRGKNQQAFLHAARGLTCIRVGHSFVAVPKKEVLARLDDMLAADRDGSLLKGLLALLMKHEGD